MCGIAGHWSFNSTNITESGIEAMLARLKHRGPDDSGVYINDDASVGLGHNRLSIVDLSSAGHQPYFSADERYCMVYNGEIYNHIELRTELEQKYDFRSNSDTEVLLLAYIEWGEQCLERLNGMFAFAIYDKLEDTLFAVRDHFGIKPFYYHLSDKGFIFASEIPAILQAMDYKPKANEQAVFDFLAFNIPDQDANTMFEDILKLPHGCKLTVKNNELKISRWYNIRERLGEPFTDPAQFRALFSSAVKMQLRSDVPVGVCLSGGLDSSSIATTIVDDHGKKDLHTFSAVYGKGVRGDESEFIDTLSSKLQNMHYTVPDGKTLLEDFNDFVAIQAEPVSSTGPYAQYRVMELAGKHVTVTLDGQGADEQLGGYHYFFGFHFKSLLTSFRWFKLFGELKDYLKIHRSMFGLVSFLFVLFPPWLQTRLRVSSKGGIHQAFSHKYRKTSRSAERFFASKDFTDAAIKHFEYKLDHLLKWGDRNSMRFSVESRVPFLDYRLVERTLATDSSLLMKKGVTKTLLREAMADLLPQKLVNRQDKMGFATPDNDWFRTPEMKKVFIDTLDSTKARERNVLDIDKVMSLYQLHLDGKKNIAGDLWKWLNLELWYRAYID